MPGKLSYQTDLRSLLTLSNMFQTTLMCVCVQKKDSGGLLRGGHGSALATLPYSGASRF